MNYSRLLITVLTITLTQGTLAYRVRAQTQPVALGATPQPSPYPTVQPGYPPQTVQPPTYMPTQRYQILRPIGYHRHDGFFLRLSAGPHFMATMLQGRSARLSGLGSSLSLQIGGAISEHVILHGNLTRSTAYEPEYRVQDELIRENYIYVYSMTGMGFGASFYFPNNSYIDLSLEYIQPSFSRRIGPNDVVGQGLQVPLKIGHEWWVGDNWAIGISAQFLYGYARSIGDWYDKAGDVDFNMHTLGGGLLLSVTYD